MKAIKQTLDTIEVHYWHRHPCGVRPGWRPVWVRKSIFHPVLTTNLLMINWRDKEIVIEWTTRAER